MHSWLCDGAGPAREPLNKSVTWVFIPPGRSCEGRNDREKALAVNDLFRLSLELSNDPFYWNEACSGSAMDYADPDPGLVKIIDGLRPGRALDMGCGAGGLSVALAERKWQVTGIDIAAKAVEAARKVVQERSVNSELHLADATRWKPNRRYDQTVSSFAHPDSKAGRALVYRMIRDAIASGGTVLLKDFDATMKRVKFFAAFDLVTVEEFTAGFDSLNIWSINTDNPMKYGLASAKEGKLGIDGGLYQTEDANDQPGVRLYAQVDDAQAYIEQAASLGGTVVGEA